VFGLADRVCEGWVRGFWDACEWEGKVREGTFRGVYDSTQGHTYRHGEDGIRQHQPALPMQDHAPIKMATADDGGGAGQDLGVGLVEKPQLCVGGRGAVGPGVGIALGKVHGAAEGGGPVGPGGVEVGVGDQD
jgi:hypothetical protein